MAEELRICYYKNMFLVQCIQYPIFNKIRWDNGTTVWWSRCLMHTVSVDWFLSSLEWILNLELCYKFFWNLPKLLRNIRSRLNSSPFWVFRPVFRYVWLKLKLFAQKMKILIKLFKSRLSIGTLDTLPHWTAIDIA